MISEETRAYYDLKKRNDVRESAKRIRRQFLRYKDAEIIYSLQHKKILELASAAGAIYRMDEGTNVSNIVVSKHLRSNNTSGHTGVGLDRRTGKWYAYINFQKKHYNLGLHKDKSAAIRARRAAEARLHDPVILEYWDSLTEKRKKEFQDYLRSTNK